MMQADIEELRNEAERIRMLYRAGLIDLDRAKQQLLPYAEAFNSKSRELAKKYHQRPTRFSPISFLR